MKMATEYACELDRCDLLREDAEDRALYNDEAASWWLWARAWGPWIAAGAAVIGFAGGIYIGTTLDK